MSCKSNQPVLAASLSAFLALASCGPASQQGTPIDAQERLVAQLSQELDRLESLREEERLVGPPDTTPPLTPFETSEEWAQIEAEADWARAEAKKARVQALAEAESQALLRQERASVLKAELEAQRTKASALQFRLAQYQSLGFVSDEQISTQADLDAQLARVRALEASELGFEQELRMSSAMARSTAEAESFEKQNEIERDARFKQAALERAYQRNVAHAAAKATPKKPTAEALYLETDERYREALWLLNTMQNR